MVELLVASLLASLVLGAALSLLRSHVALARRVQAELAALGDAAWALEIAARDIELAGADPARRDVVAIRAAGADRVSVDSDHDGDGAIDDGSAERLALSWSSASGGRLLRRLGAQSTSLATSVPRGGFLLRYFDSAGVELPAPAAGLSAEACARVRRVRLELAVRREGAESPGETRLWTNATLRSRQSRP